MTTRKIFFIVIALFLLLMLGIAWFYISRSQETGVTPNGTSGIFGNLFPFGQGPAEIPGSGQSTDGSGGEGGSASGVSQKLRQLTSAAVAGAVVFTDANGKYRVRYVEKALGHVYEAFEGSNIPERLSNTTVPKVQEALLFSNSTSTILRYLNADEEGITTFSGVINGGELIGSFLPQNIRGIASSPTGELAYIIGNGAGVDLVTTLPNGSSKTVVISLPTTEWRVMWPSTNTLTLTTKPSGESSGFMYSLFRSTKTLTPMLGNIRGLTGTANQSLSRVVFAESGEDTITLGQLIIKTGDISTLPLNTLPADKCVWSTLSDTVIFCAVPAEIPPGLYPDAWYQGLVSFADNIWEIDLESGNATLLGILEDGSGAPIDVIEPFISEGDRHFFFKNKKDSTLWSLQLTDN
ncbi:hypothetical protein A2841_04095 [Candidatus Kaiserbacteria bacterium RIFCSPHIGHO2_01_FULL_48_10]|uniref:Uncharacterized protein n=1 Tax=Candidatus Kaiserbacteria bacterium RIFCSPHIGHO2_01_FULL_48_10 TaxID=1798476 RepID=A0A1F6C580_9BACT|nr:MAG: hypothetical protein A2841_04095 [Candidatus Kaiserbacteria bacterium RIFCSPHIGHO2_01_FULL_48_10]